MSVAARWHIGPNTPWDDFSSLCFEVLKSRGMLPSHKLLDLGCGCLRVGVPVINYLDAGNYCGIDSEQWVIDDGIRDELTASVYEAKRPRFIGGRDDFPCKEFGEVFDFVLVHGLMVHLGNAQMPVAFCNIAGVLGPNGQCLFTYLGGPDNGRTGLSYPGVITYSRATIERWADEAGLIVEHFPVAHPDPQIWACATLR